MDLSGQVSVVTGGTSGIGAGVAAKLSAAGATVVTWDISQQADVICDVSHEDSIEHAIAETVARWGVPQVLVAAAGVSGRPGALTEMAVDEWDRVHGVNIRGVFLSMRVVARELVRSNLGGSMVLIASVNGILADPGSVAYSTSKAAVLHLARVGAVELGPVGIRLNAVGPGPTDTPMLAPVLDSAYRLRVESATPLRRIGTPDLVADGVVNILKSDWITGQVIMVDGGSSLMSARGDRLDHLLSYRR